MKELFAFLFIIIGIGFIILVNFKIKKGQLKPVETYSFKSVFIRSLLLFFLVIVLTVIIYLLSRSIEVTIGLGVLLLMGVVASLLYGLLWENQTKRRGGRKAD
jgi:hypothetical protein